MRAVDALEALELLGSTQRGLVTTSRAREAGVSAVDLTRLTDAGRLLRVRHGVYALPSAGPDRFQDLRAAWLAASANGDVVVSGASAAALHGLGDLVPASHDFTATTRRQTSLPDVRFHRAELSEDDVTVVDDLPVTGVARTVGDLAASSLDSGHLAGVLSSAVERSDLDPEELARQLAPHVSSYGYDTVHALLAALAPEYLTVVLRNAVSAAVTFSPRFRKEALALLEKHGGAETLLSLLKKRFAA